MGADLTIVRFFSLPIVSACYTICQPLMEHKLRSGAARYTQVLVRFGVEVTGREQDADGETLTVKNLASNTSDTVRARHVLGVGTAGQPQRASK